MTDLAIPAGFEPLVTISNYVKELGPIHYRAEGRLKVLGLHIRPQHLNLHHNAHGGMLLTLADTALGINLSGAQEPPIPMVTANLNSEFLAPAKEGDWVEAHVEILKQGRRLGFAECRLKVGERLILRASATFAVVAPVVPEPSDG